MTLRSLVLPVVSTAVFGFLASMLVAVWLGPACRTWVVFWGFCWLSRRAMHYF